MHHHCAHPDRTFTVVRKVIRKKKGSIEWLEFELFDAFPQIVHGVFLRHGGVSREPHYSLNISPTTGDDPQNVVENRKRISATLSLDHLITFGTVHGNHVDVLSEKKEEYANCDGLITVQKNCGILIPHADCQAAIFYDPVNHAIAGVHAGWRGQVKNIYREAVLKMSQAFGSKPADLLVGISPSLGPLNSEFKNFREELPEEFLPFQFKPTYFDLWALARHQLEECGILPRHIEIASIDTYAHPEDFFSYRREKATAGQKKITGSHGTVVGLIPSRL